MVSKNIKRQDMIQHIVQERGGVSVGALAEMLDVSMQTIRRDLDVLCDGKTLKRAHGRIELADGRSNTSFDQRMGTNLLGKRAIAELAASHIPDGSTIFVSIGSSVLSVAHALRGRQELTIITNNLSVAMALSDDPSNRILIPGGEIRLPDRDLIGESVVEFFSRYRADFAIFGTAGIGEDGVLLEFHASEVCATEQMRKNAQVSMLIIDHSKFGRSAPAVGANISDVDMVYCDRSPPPPFSDMLSRLDAKIQFAEGAN
jgi:DeoR family glycerol-3-phosphate regulon repressor